MRRPTLALALFLSLAPAAQAFDITAMTPEEQAAFGEAIKAYLLAHPEVMLEVQDALKQKQLADQIANDKAVIAQNAMALFSDGVSYVGGNPQGDVTVVEFLDYHCGYCRQAYAEVDQLVKTDGNIRFVVKEFPILGDGSLLASRFAIAARKVAGDEAYVKIGQGFYTDFRGDITPETLKAFSDGLGLDTLKIFAAMNDPAIRTEIEANYAMADKLAVSGTPTFVIGDQVLRGYVPLADMQAVVAEVRKD